MEKLPTAALDMIPESTRWTIANALRTACDKFKANAKDFREMRSGPYHQLAEQFDQQAADAADMADQFENC